MDNRRFDQMTRSIASATNRRAFIRRLLGMAGVAAGVAAVQVRETEAARRGFSGPSFLRPDTCRPEGASCAANAECCTSFCSAYGTCATCDYTICGDFVCVNLQFNPYHCGSCGNECVGFGETCLGAVCIPPQPPF